VGTVLHELLHNVGLGGSDHAEIDFIDQRCFACAPNHDYGSFTPPSPNY